MAEAYKRLKVLCVHQGGELYGSDRSFLQCVEAIREGWPKSSIKVVLAADGPLRKKLELIADEVVVRDLAVLRLADFKNTLRKMTVGLPRYLISAYKDISWADVVYINTTVIADYIIACRVNRKKSIIHAREIPKAKALKFVQGLIKFSGASIIFNSIATQNSFKISSSQNSAVIYNGVEEVLGAIPPKVPLSYDEERPLRIVVLGRISDWKGQDLLVESLCSVPHSYRNKVKVRIVGSSYKNNKNPIIILEMYIAASGLAGNITIEPFCEDTNEIYEWADVCVVPSRLPEPFGRVAIEAMSHARPVIAANHGGLTEIVDDNHSGWLFSPNNANDLAKKIIDLVDNPEQVFHKGKSSKLRFEKFFSSSTMKNNIINIIRKWIL